MQGWIPRPLIIAAIVLVSVVELVFRVPDLLLIKERYDAQKAEYLSKLVLPDTARAQLQKAQADADRAVSEAKTAQLQPDIAVATLAKAGFDATVARYAADAAPNQPPTAKAQLEKARNDAEASAYQPDLTKVSLDKVKSEAATAALQPDFTKIQMAKLGVDTQVAVATLPANLQAAAMSNNMMTAMAPIMSLLTGVMHPQQEAPAAQQDPAPAQGSPPSRQQSTAVSTRAPVTGPALLTTDHFNKLTQAAHEAVDQRDCAKMLQVYKEAMPIVRSAIGKLAKEDIPEVARQQALEIVGLRLWINDPSQCNGERVN
jgi:hypothetical protein